MSGNNRRRDVLFAAPLPSIESFEFSHDVVSVFPDMINRSVPGYATIISMIGLLAKKYAQEGSQCYDLGCSLGAASFSMWQQIRHNRCHIIGVDSSLPMVEKFRALCKKENADEQITVKHEDLCQVKLENASVVVLNFTLQFIPEQERDGIIQKIHDAMRPGGLLVISEKIRFEDPHLDQLNIELHENFKRLNGYSELEISQKRQALENVLIPEPIDKHRKRIMGCGFSKFDAWFQCFNFVSMLAIK